MSYRSLPSIPKWAFIIGDALLLLVAFAVVLHTPSPMGLGALTLVVFCVFAGACLSIVPFVLEYQAAVKITDIDNLLTAANQIKNLKSLAQQIAQATASWQGVQEHCTQAVTGAREIGDRMAAEAAAFGQFLEKANDSERKQLRLELDKMRQGEQECLHVLVRVLDHVYALYLAGTRSGQPALIEQLGHFQSACRDSVRRLGLVPLEVPTNAPYDPAHHELVEGESGTPGASYVSELLATGYSFQGQLMRKPLVGLASASTPLPQAAPVEDAPPAAERMPGSSAHEAAAAPTPARGGRARSAAGADLQSVPEESPSLFDELPRSRRP